MLSPSAVVVVFVAMLGYLHEQFVMKPPLFGDSCCLSACHGSWYGSVVRTAV